MSGDKSSFDADRTLVHDHGVLVPGGVAQKSPRLELVRGPGSPREFLLLADETVIGRSQQATICIESGLLSRRHALLRKSGPELRLVDLESANGVYVNGVRIHSAGLCEGDAIQIGDAIFVYREGG